MADNVKVSLSISLNISLCVSGSKTPPSFDTMSAAVVPSVKRALSLRPKSLIPNETLLITLPELAVSMAFISLTPSL